MSQGTTWELLHGDVLIEQHSLSERLFFFRHLFEIGHGHGHVKADWHGESWRCEPYGRGGPGYAERWCY